MEHYIPIRTRRLTLRPLRRTDIPDVVALVNDYDVSRWLSVVPFPYTHADGEEFLTFLETADPLEALAIIAPEGFVGVVGIGGSLGYWLGRKYHGRGYMSEAAGALVDTYFGMGTSERLTSGYFTGNHASRNVLSKLGFVADGSEKVKSLAQDAEVTLEKVILTRSDWLARNGH